jgi:hypothetical protein
MVLPRNKDIGLEAFFSDPKYIRSTVATNFQYRTNNTINISATYTLMNRKCLPKMAIIQRQTLDFTSIELKTSHNFITISSSRDFHQQRNAGHTQIMCNDGGLTSLTGSPKPDAESC